MEFAGDSVAMPQGHTGKGANLRAPRANHGLRAPLAQGRYPPDRMEAGEVEAKALCDWPERRPSAGLPCSQETEKLRRRNSPGLFFYEEQDF